MREPGRLNKLFLQNTLDFIVTATVLQSLSVSPSELNLASSHSNWMKGQVKSLCLFTRLFMRGWLGNGINWVFKWRQRDSQTYLVHLLGFDSRFSQYLWRPVGKTTVTQARDSPYPAHSLHSVKSMSSYFV